MNYELFSPQFYRWWSWGIEVKYLIQGHAYVGSAGIWTKSVPQPAYNTDFLNKIFGCLLLFVYFFSCEKERKWRKNEAVRKRNHRDGKSLEDEGTIEMEKSSAFRAGVTESFF